LLQNISITSIVLLLSDRICTATARLHIPDWTLQICNSQLDDCSTGDRKKF